MILKRKSLVCVLLLLLLSIGLLSCSQTKKKNLKAEEPQRMILTMNMNSYSFNYGKYSKNKVTASVITINVSKYISICISPLGYLEFKIAKKDLPGIIKHMKYLSGLKGNYNKKKKFGNSSTPYSYIYLLRIRDSKKFLYYVIILEHGSNHLELRLSKGQFIELRKFFKAAFDFNPYES